MLISYTLPDQMNDCTYIASVTVSILSIFISQDRALKQSLVHITTLDTFDMCAIQKIL